MITEAIANAGTIGPVLDILRLLQPSVQQSASGSTGQTDRWDRRRTKPAMNIYSKKRTGIYGRTRMYEFLCSNKIRAQSVTHAVEARAGDMMHLLYDGNERRRRGIKLP